MSPRRRRIAAIGLGFAAAAAAVAANLVLLGQARSDDPMGRLSPALTAGIAPVGNGPGTGTVTGPAATSPATTVTAPSVTDDSGGDDDHDDDAPHDDDRDDD